QLIELSKQFVMISCDGTNDPEGDAFEIGIVFSITHFKNSIRIKDLFVYSVHQFIDFTSCNLIG
ncbi:MAG: hypothetical protein PUD59_06690, partial [bacterium]|nr:hypothetical protein [bacterium]